MEPLMSDLPLSADVALVTGATRGIGAAIARALAGAGARVVGTATSAAGAGSIGAALAGVGPGGRGAIYDAADPAGVEALLADMDAHEGLPTILVNNAGMTRDGLILRMKNEDWDQTININLSAAFRLSKASLKRMLKERRGRIISITSVVGSIGNAGQVNYAAAKAGLEGFTRSLAREVASRGITVNAVAPGFIDTDMTGALNETQRAAYCGQIPLARFGSVDDVAAAVLYLAGPGAGYVTGHTLHVNGGMYMG
jgi:3-oxoacyl-[acyl-carrier protein] reductase